MPHLSKRALIAEISAGKVEEGGHNAHLDHVGINVILSHRRGDEQVSHRNVEVQRGRVVPQGQPQQLEEATCHQVFDLL